jgi:hypothetical protein
MVINVTLPFDNKNPDKALASMKIGTHGFFSQNNDLMDMVVVAENNDKTTKDHQSIAEESLKINPHDYAEDESPDSTSSEQP